MYIGQKTRGVKGQRNVNRNKCYQSQAIIIKCGSQRAKFAGRRRKLEEIRGENIK